MPRHEMEKSLIFVGFLVFDSDLKADSKSVVRELKATNHQVIMITGDSVYTTIIDVDYHRLGMIKSATDKNEESSSVIILFARFVEFRGSMASLG